MVLAKLPGLASTRRQFQTARAMMKAFSIFVVSGVVFLTPALAQEITVKRGYVDSSFGQVHYRIAQPVQNTTKPPLICFHHTPGSSRHFDPFIRIMGRDRTVIAFDTPGYGQSEPPPTPVPLEGYAAALGDAVAALGYGGEETPIDVLGYLTGSLIATELAVTRPTMIRRLILVSSPVWTAEERPGRMERWEQFETWSDDGSYVLNALTTTLTQAKSEPPQLTDYRLEGFVDGILPGADWDWAERAAIQYPTIDKQPLIRQKTLALVMHDFPNDAAFRAKDIIRDVEVVDFRRVDRFAFKQIPGEIAEEVIRFLDSPD